MGAQLYFDNYSPVGDLTVVATCLVIVILLATSYVNKTRAFAIYVNIVSYLTLAALCDVIYHTLYTHVTDGNYGVVYVLRVVYHALLFSNLLLYVVYVVELQRLEKDKKAPVMLLATLTYLTVIVTDIITSVTGTGFKLDETGTAVSGQNIFLYGYLAFMAILGFLMIAYRKRLFMRVMMGFYGTAMISFLILFQQGRHGQSSYTVVSFLFPTLAMLYLIHSTPYDVEIGSLSIQALEDTVRYHYKRGHDLVFMSLFLPELESEGRRFSKNLQEAIRRFSAEYFKDATLFQVSNGHVILFARLSKNPDYQEKERRMLEAFQPEYERFRYDYKIVRGTTIDEISQRNAYVSFIKSIHLKMKINSVHEVEAGDVEKFEEYEYILSELNDVTKKQDPFDPRVLVYCQPVYNLRTKTYDTAEALMRLKLPKLGLVTPDKFIQLAEESGNIHSLTKVLLRKTCTEIGALLADGFEVNRVSVNVSVIEMREEGFSNEVSEIIRECGIPQEKIAIEITESQSENDFYTLKNRIGELKDKGIKFYLDDFGTGYSNMERILELPFDIIKFDRALVLACNASERSEKMVGSLANMFSELDYFVLYEGVETDGDERMCEDMYATYLQGYKYSKPVPIKELRNFFSKAVTA